MLCPNCGKENKNNAAVCEKCHQPLNKKSVKAVNIRRKTAADTADDTEVKTFEKREERVNVGIYKLLCIAMGLCLIAGSVVWASLLLRDRIDSGITPMADSGTKQSAADSDSDSTSTATAAAKTTTATTTATTTTTTTTADPYSEAVSPQFEDDYGTLYVVTDSLVVRIGPGYDYEKTGETLEAGTALSILAEQEDTKSGETWCYISGDTAEGWVSKSCLSENNPTVTVVLPDEYYSSDDKTWFKIIRYGGVKMYAGPGEEYDVIANIDEGEEMQKEGYNYFSVKWIYTCYNGQYGWIASYDGSWLNPTTEEI